MARVAHIGRMFEADDADVAPRQCRQIASVRDMGVSLTNADERIEWTGEVVYLQSADPRLVVVESAAVVGARGLDRPRQHRNCKYQNNRLDIGLKWKSSRDNPMGLQTPHTCHYAFPLC